MSKKMLVPTFHVHYVTEGGILMILSGDYVVLVRIRDVGGGSPVGGIRLGGMLGVKNV